MSRRPRRSDPFTRRAKAQSYPARSVFKLEEIDRKHHLIRPGAAVLDLGCAPGSWLLYVAGRVGPQGIAVGIDSHGVKVGLPRNARYLRASVFDTTPEALIEAAGRPYDVVLSDMAPHTSGNKFVDQQRSLRLLERAMELALNVSRSGSAFVGKVFHGEDVENARDRAKEWYRQVKLTRPQATRKRSYEVYLVCLDRREGAVTGDEM